MQGPGLPPGFAERLLSSPSCLSLGGEDVSADVVKVISYRSITLSNIEKSQFILGLLINLVMNSAPY